MNCVDPRLSKPPYPIFSQFISAFDNHELHVSSYDEREPVDHNLAFLGVKDSGKGR